MLEQYGEIKLKVYGRNQIKNESKLSFETKLYIWNVNSYSNKYIQ